MGNLDSLKSMDTNTKGKITELEVLTYVTKLGISVSIPYGDKDRYDQIWDVNKKLYKIQVKTSKWKEENKSFVFKCKTTYLRSSGYKESYYTKDDIDFFATFFNGKCYLIPVEECSTQKVLRFEPPANHQKDYNKAENYEVEEVLKRI